MRKLLGFALVVSTCALFRPSIAEACGGCFVPQTERTVVTDHRMALSISPQQTVLWDQIRYSGDPAEFAWVLPVHAGAKLEISNDEWFSALDASTQPVVYEPNRFGGRVGCGLTGCASESSAAESTAGGGQVQVLSQSVVGPYETVTLRATDDDALRHWLTSHDYSIPESITPTIDAYVREGFDFIALRLRPGCNERSMQPVRVVTNGADPTLPLRMVAAGVGPRVGITLYVITEGRWQPQNFESALIDDDRLTWDRIAGKSNYEEHSQEVMGRANGRTWITEYANKPQLPLFPRYEVSGANPGLTDTYFGLCRVSRASTPTPSTTSPDASTTFTPCPKADAGVDPQQQPIDAGGDADEDADAGAPDAEAPDADASDAEAAPDASAPDAEPEAAYVGDLRPSHPDCRYLDDLDVAVSGLHRGDVWVTRLRAVLPVDALSAGDLRLIASPEQRPVSNVHWAPYYADEDAAPESSKSSCLSAPKDHRTYGSWAFGSIAAIALVAWVRRRRPRR